MERGDQRTRRRSGDEDRVLCAVSGCLILISGAPSTNKKLKRWFQQVDITPAPRGHFISTNEFGDDAIDSTTDHTQELHHETTQSRITSVVTAAGRDVMSAITPTYTTALTSLGTSYRHVELTRRMTTLICDERLNDIRSVVHVSRLCYQEPLPRDKKPR